MMNLYLIESCEDRYGHYNSAVVTARSEDEAAKVGTGEFEFCWFNDNVVFNVVNLGVSNENVARVVHVSINAD